MSSLAASSGLLLISFNIFLNFLPLGPLINIQKVMHFTHFEIIKHSLSIIAPVVKTTVPEKEIKKVINMSLLYVF